MSDQVRFSQLSETRIQDICRAALLARLKTNEEMFLAGLAWIEECYQIAVNNQ